MKKFLLSILCAFFCLFGMAQTEKIYHDQCTVIPDDEPQEPDDIDDKGHASALIFDFFSERIERDRRKLKALHSNRDTHNGDAPENSGQKPSERAEKASEDYPKNVSYYPHFLPP